MLLLLGVGNLSQLAACEACGCSIMFWEMGLTPRFQSHQLSMGWNHQRFTSFNSLEAKALGQTGSQEYFQQLDLQLQLRLHQRWRLSVALPYAFLQREIAGETWHLDGWSDPSVLLQYVVLDQEHKKRTAWRHRLSVGLGAKLPLARQNNPPMNWNWSAGYIFVRIDGMVDLNGDGTPETPMEYHLGKEPFRRVIAKDLHTDIEDDNQTLAFGLDVAALFEGIDVTQAYSVHTGDDLATSAIFADNIADAITKK